MPAKISLPSFLSKPVRSKKPLYVIAVMIVIGLAAWANSTWAAATASSSTPTAITPALRLAAGTLALEKNSQAIDAASAAKLLPLWRLLAQLQDSSAAAPQEITAVLDEIKLNMTSAQVEAIDGMSFSQAELGGTSAARTSSTQVASVVNDPMLGGGMPAGGIPMDGGGPGPGSGPRNGITASSSASAASSTPSLIDQVIQLLAKKAQS